MKIKMNFNKKILCYLSSILLVVFLSGCKGKDQIATVFSGLPEGMLVLEMKSAIEDKKPIVVAFTAEWCPHCRAYKPVFFDVKTLYSDAISFINIDVDSKEGSVLSERFQVKGIPTTAFVRPDGSVFKVQVGEIEKENLKTLVDKLSKSKKKKRGEPVAPFPIEPLEVKATPKEETPEEEALPQEVIEQPAEGKAEEEPKTQQETKPEIEPEEENTTNEEEKPQGEDQEDIQSEQSPEEQSEQPGEE